ncbi:hypothetical protein C4578_04190 [Candidatus Microgenomates bacterium]|jgi:DNA polymerase-1|nr:MAG: hypothetical protein C4578_04190 [Candidatus Microgenomates bacterium]
MDQEKLVLVDGNAILHRAYHALPELTTRNGEMVNAVYGFSLMILKIIEELNPQYLAVSFDTASPNFRHQEFVGYKANRPKMDLELANQIDRVHELVRAFNIPILEVDGYEADDVIGTLAKQAEKEKNLEVLIVTGDKDLMQLVSDKVKLYMPTRGLSEASEVGVKEVEEKLQISPQKVVDYKGLVGDQSDNYPGVPGIGPKTATDLLEKFGSIEGIYENLDQIQSKNIKEKLEQGKESAFISKKLARISIEAPVKLHLQKCLASDYDKKKVLALFKELNFRSLVARISGEEKKEDEKKEGDQQKLF